MSGLIARVYRAFRLITDARERRVRRWFAANGDKVLRLGYPLTPDSMVFDVGGYEGNWAADIDALYHPTIHVFEPVGAFHQAIAGRFIDSPRIYIWPFGLAGSDGSAPIALAGDSSSIHRGMGTTTMVRLRSFAGFMAEQGIRRIDLLKINIEGGEYELLEHILDHGLAPSITDIQVQFHDFVPNARARMQAVQERLRATHALTWQYEFVWENWSLL